MLNSTSDGLRHIRQILFENALDTDSFCFSLDVTDDAGKQGRGDLFRQDEDFFMVETEIDEVSRAGPGQYAPVRVWGRLDLSYYTMDRSNDLGAFARIEEIAGWWAGDTRHGIRFREFLPVTADALMGFQVYAGTIPFEFEAPSTFKG